MEAYMALDDIFQGNLGAGLLFGLGAVVLAPFATRVLRPVAKAAIKGGMTVYRDTGIGDATGDLVAEARAELDARRESDQGEEGRARRAKRTEPQPA
jgi:hypothetical protein